MVASFSPRSNSSNPCEGIVDYEAGRPIASAELRYVNLAFFVLAMGVHLITVYTVWKWRNTPRFHKIRPFSLSVLLLLGFMLYGVPSYLAFVVHLPCALFIIFYTIALAWFAAILSIRGWVLTVETYYARLMKDEKVLSLQDDRASNALSVAPSHVEDGAIISYLKDVLLLTQVAVGYVRLSHLAIVELVVIKNRYQTMFCLISIPALVTIGLLIGIVPPFQGCYDCDIFAELPIAYSVCLTIYMLLAFRVGVEAYLAAGWDEMGNVFEIAFTAGIIAPTALAIWLLMVFDPGNATYERRFNWSMLFSITTVLFWWSSFGRHLYWQWRQSGNRSSLEILDMATAFQADPESKKDFYQFATKHYIMESLQFLEDIETYKRFFFEKAESWRETKFKALVETYILSGSKMEVNLSFAMRTKILHLYENLSGKSRECFEIFDQAVKEVEQLIHDGAWTEYLMKKSRDQKQIVHQIVPVASMDTA